jgi:hypothetical protein
MIQILSQSPLEPTTEEVMDWLESFGARSMRLNGEDLDGRAPLVVEVDGGEVEIRIALEAMARRSDFRVRILPI